MDNHVNRPSSGWQLSKWAGDHVYENLPASANHVLRELIDHALIGGVYLDARRSEYGNVDTRYSKVAIIAKRTGLGTTAVKDALKYLEEHEIIRRRRASQVFHRMIPGNPVVIDLMPMIQSMFVPSDEYRGDAERPAQGDTERPAISNQSYNNNNSADGGAAPGGRSTEAPPPLIGESPGEESCRLVMKNLPVWDVIPNLWVSKVDRVCLENNFNASDIVMAVKFWLWNGCPVKTIKRPGKCDNPAGFLMTGDVLKRLVKAEQKYRQG